MSRHRFTLSVTLVVDVNHPQLVRLSTPDRETFVCRKVQDALDSGGVVDAFLDAAVEKGIEATLVDATAMTCREGRG